MKAIFLFFFLLCLLSCGGGDGGFGCTDCDDLIADDIAAYGQPDEIEYFTIDNPVPKRQWSANYYYYDQDFYIQYIQYNCGCGRNEYDF